MSKRNRWDVSNKPAQTAIPAHSAAQAAAAAIAARINEAVAALQQKIEPSEPTIFSEGYTTTIPFEFVCLEDTTAQPDLPLATDVDINHSKNRAILTQSSTFNQVIVFEMRKYA